MTTTAALDSIRKKFHQEKIHTENKARDTFETARDLSFQKPTKAIKMPKANLGGKTKATMAGGRRVKKGTTFTKKKTSVESLQALPDVNVETEEIVSSRKKITASELNVSRRETRSTTASKTKVARRPNASVRARGQLKQVRKHGSKKM